MSEQTISWNGKKLLLRLVLTRTQQLRMIDNELLNYSDNFLELDSDTIVTLYNNVHVAIAGRRHTGSGHVQCRILPAYVRNNCVVDDTPNQQEHLPRQQAAIFDTPSRQFNPSDRWPASPPPQNKSTNPSKEQQQQPPAAKPGSRWY